MKTGKISLRSKAILSILVMATILIFSAAYISYLYYSDTMDAYYKDVTMNVAETVAAVVPAESIESYRDAAMEVYWENPAQEFETWEDYEAYLAQFAHIIDDSYMAIYDELIEIRDTNELLYLYICYMDPVTMTGVYLIDADDSDYACPIGTWDIIYEENYEAMTHPEAGFPAYITQTEDYGWLSSAGAAILTESGEVVGHVFVETSVDEMMNDRSEFLMSLVCLLGIATLVLLLLFIYLTNRAIVRPIGVITKETREFIAHKQSPTQNLLQIRTRDELQELAGSVHQMQVDILSYIQDLTSVTAEKERVATELNVARSIQEGMLPCLFPAFPERKELDIYATITPAKEMAGDFYDFFLVDEDHMALVMADVSGKGVPAALFMIVSRTLIKNTAQAGLSPKEILEKVNNQLCENNEGDLFVTVWIGIYEISTGNMLCANAGHEYPIISRQGGEFELLKDKHGFVLGGMENMRYSEYALHLDVGDRLFLYTDGIPEATDKQELLFGNERMLASLNRHRHGTTRQQLEGMIEEVDAFVGDAPQFDDITMIAFQRAESPETETK